MQKESKYVLYVKSTCPFCIKAQELLNICDKEYRTVNLDANPVLFESMKQAWEWKTVPMVFEFSGNDPSNTKFIGGYTDLKSVLIDE